MTVGLVDKKISKIKIENFGIEISDSYFLKFGVGLGGSGNYSWFPNFEWY